MTDAANPDDDENDTGPHGERRSGAARPAAAAPIARDYGEPGLKDEAEAPGDRVQGSDGQPVKGH